MLLLPEEQKGEPWEPSNQRAINRKILSLFIFGRVMLNLFLGLPLCLLALWEIVNVTLTHSTVLMTKFKCVWMWSVILTT